MYVEEHSKARDGAVVAVMCRGGGERKCREAARLKLWYRSEACWF